jgi:hypothetical protein
MWDWSGRHRQGANPSCGERHATDRGAPVHKPQSLTRLLKAKRPGGKCEYASGPFLYPDGSLEIVGRGLLEAVFTSRRVLDFARTNLARTEPPIWSHEDVGIGALVHREVSARGFRSHSSPAACWRVCAPGSTGRTLRRSLIGMCSGSISNGPSINTLPMHLPPPLASRRRRPRRPYSVASHVKRVGV